MKHPLQHAAERIEEELASRPGQVKPIKTTRATLVYGPYREKDGTKDTFCVSFFDPETGEHGEPRWVEGIGSLAHLLEEELDPRG